MLKKRSSITLNYNLDRIIRYAVLDRAVIYCNIDRNVVCNGKLGDVCQLVYPIRISVRSAFRRLHRSQRSRRIYYPSIFNTKKSSIVVSKITPSLISSILCTPNSIFVIKTSLDALLTIMSRLEVPTYI